MTTTTNTATTKLGDTATRAPKHRGNTWLIRRDNSSALVELSPALDITQFDFDVSEDNWEFVATIHSGTRTSGDSHWFFQLGNVDDGTFASQEVAEKHLLLHAGKYKSAFVSEHERVVCYWGAVKALAAVRKKYAKYLSFEGDPGAGPKLMQHWSLIGEPTAWAVVWEQGSPDEWALRWGMHGKREDPTGLFMEPLCSFALGVYSE